MEGNVLLFWRYYNNVSIIIALVKHTLKYVRLGILISDSELAKLVKVYSNTYV